MAPTIRPVPLGLSRAIARRFLVLRHHLAPPRALPPMPESVLAVVGRLGSLQFDPLEVPGARNHDLVLHSRIEGYRREWCEAWLYGPDRRLFEIYNKGLNIVPLAELPHYRIGWERNARALEDGIVREQAPVVEAILEGIRRDGPLSTAAFAEHDHAVDWWWAPTRAARAVAEALFVSGRIGIARREGNRRYYDLIERLVPAELIGRREPEEEAMRHRLLSRYRATGLSAPSAQAEVMYGAGSAAERTRRTAELVERGDLKAVEVEGLKGQRYIVANELAMLEEASAWSGRDPAGVNGVSFIAPLDPLLWDRRLLRELWAFDYLWEVYVPEAKRRWGYYVLPILWGDRFVGRIEPRLERPSVTPGQPTRAVARAGRGPTSRASSTLAIRNVWWEEGFAPDEPLFATGFGAALEAYRAFLGAAAIRWPPHAAVRALRRAMSAM